ncbi:MAG: asparagine synthase [Saccharothrix sp.]|nr:asparagine synthase [Saccharothrix sp.]
MEFVVLSDHPAADDVYRRLPEAYRANTLRHHSGRPWVVGRWSADAVTHVEAGSSKLVLLGSAHATGPELALHLGKTRHPRDLDKVAERTAGCFHLIASLDGVVRAQGSLSTARQLFYTSVAGTTVLANRISVLGELRTLTLAEEHLAMNLLSYAPPWPLNERTAWREVQSVPFAHFLSLHRDGAVGSTRWWTPPEPDLPVDAAAPRLREALFDAVAARSRTSGIGADLSGGMDSTSLCFIAADQRHRLVTLRRQSLDPANPDEAVARRAETDMPGARHIVLTKDTASQYYDSADRVDLDVDGPPPFIAIRSHFDDVARIMAAQGIRSHLQGHGSDELAATGVTYANAIARRDLIGSLATVRAIRAMRRWSLTTTLRVVRAFPPYADWLHRSGDRLLAPPKFEAEVGWEPTPQLPPWASQGAAELVRDTIRSMAASDPRPLSALPVQHEVLRSILVNGTMVRSMGPIGDRFDVSFEAPFLDARVVETALSVRLSDRYVPGRAKPVLAAALRGVVPDYILDRTTKGHLTVDMYVGRKRNLEKLRAMCEESRLVSLGLVDRAGFRRALVSIMPDAANINPLEKTVACEAWLRSLAHAHPAGDRGESTSMEAS